MSLLWLENSKWDLQLPNSRGNGVCDFWGYIWREPLWFSQVPVPDVMMPNSLLLPAAVSEKSERDTPAAITAEGSGKYPGEPAGEQALRKHASGSAVVVGRRDYYYQRFKKKEEEIFSYAYLVFWLSVTALGGPKCWWPRIFCVLTPQHGSMALGITLIVAHDNDLGLLFFPILKFLEAKGDFLFTFVPPVPPVRCLPHSSCSINIFSRNQWSRNLPRLLLKIFIGMKAGSLLPVSDLCLPFLPHRWKSTGWQKYGGSWGFQG